MLIPNLFQTMRNRVIVASSKLTFSFAWACLAMLGFQLIDLFPQARASTEGVTAPVSVMVKAINIGGALHQDINGILYQGDTILTSTPRGEISTIKGAQDPTIYRTYRRGDIEFSLEVENGVYNIIFMFAEPDEVEIGSRVFNIWAEQRKVVADLDVCLARDANPRSALDRAIANVKVKDGTLDIKLEAIKGDPILSGIIVQRNVVRSEEWQLIWQDDFAQGETLDLDKWSYDLWPAKKVNDEDQMYTDQPKNIRLQDSKLIIEAHKEEHGDAEYSSARIHTKGKGDWLYGRVEVRAKLPAGQGTWPAIWMLPSDPFKYATKCTSGTDWQGNAECDAWPNSGEIDIMEHVGYDMNRVHGTVHTKAFYWVNGEQRKASIEGVDVSKDFHVYSLEWGPNKIDMFMDDVRYFSYVRQSDNWQEWPFDHPYHLILNVAVGGAWGRAGGPVDETAFPARMEVDYVRVYSLKQ